MAKKFKVSKDTGLLVDLETKKDPITGTTNFLEKYKGIVKIFNVEKSKVAKKIDAKTNDLYAIKY